MKRFILITLLLLPFTAPATDGALGEGSPWFVQVNLAAMRGASDDGALYGWLRREVIEDLEEEFGEGTIDELDALAVFGAGPDRDGFSVMVEGRLDEELRDTVIRRLAAESLSDVDGAYLAGADKELAERFDLEIEGGSLYLGFDEDSAVFVTTRRSLLDAFLAGDRFAPLAASDLLVLRAEPMLSGGVDTAALGEGHGHWDSQVMRNIRRAGFALTDAAGGYDVRVELIAVDGAQAQALQNIVQGLIGLQTLSASEGDPELSFLSSLKSEREDDRVSLSVNVSSDEMLELLD